MLDKMMEMKQAITEGKAAYAMSASLGNPVPDMVGAFVLHAIIEQHLEVLKQYMGMNLLFRKAQ
jgi:hypothetical protein